MTYQETPTQKVLEAFEAVLKDIAEVHLYKWEPPRGFPIPAIVLTKSSGPRFSQEAALGEIVASNTRGNMIHVFIELNVWARKADLRDTYMDQAIKKIAAARSAGTFRQYGVEDVEVYLPPRDLPYDEDAGLYRALINYHTIYLSTRAA